MAPRSTPAIGWRLTIPVIITTVRGFCSLLPDMVEGFKAGVSGYKSRIQGGTSPVVDVNLTVLGAALNYSTANIDLATEYFSIKNEDNSTAANAGSNTSNGYFVLAR